MTIHRLHGNHTCTLLPLVMALFIAPVMFLASCSDSEQRLTNGDAMSKVILNLGGASASSGDRMAASAPSNITSVSITITGPGMPPMTTTDTTLGGTIELSVPAGPARLFAVEVTTINGVYSGTAIASLPAGTTVSVPIIMQPGGLFGGNQGTAENPVVISLDESQYYTSTMIGTVGKGKSYYSISDSGTHTFLNISISALTDDADLISYGGDGNFNELVAPNFGQTYCGRTKDEFLNESGPPNPYFFVIDGSHTKNGARFMINCMAHNGMVTDGPPIRTALDPNIVPIGLPYDSRVADSIPESTNFYLSIVKPGVQYWINGYNLGICTIQPFQDPLFTIPGTIPFTAGFQPAFFTVQNMSIPANISFTLEVVANEGTKTNPVELFPNEDEVNTTGRANYCMVGGAYGSSYYRFPVTLPKPSYLYFYIITAQNNLPNGDVSLAIYDGPSFDEYEQIAIVETTGQTEFFETFSYDFPNGYIYVQVTDSTGNGSTFMLDVNYMGM